jgi:hypothetical protein
MNRLEVILVAVATAVSPAVAGCEADLAEIDRQLAAATSVEEHVLQVLKQFRHQGAVLCAEGNEAGASATLESLSMLLSAQTQIPELPADLEVGQAEEQESAGAAGVQPVAQDNRGGLLPHVLVKDPHAVESLDWSALRKKAGTAYPSRWDDLSLVKSCLWITPEELAEDLGLVHRVTARETDFQCKYRVHLPDGNSGILLSVYVELHESSAVPRAAELNFSSGVGGMQFTPLDVGAPDLHVYVHKRSQYLYAFPEGGQTYWRLGFRPTYGMEDVYQPAAGADIEQEIGVRFMKLLVKKYGGLL